LSVGPVYSRGGLGRNPGLPLDKTNATGYNHTNQPNERAHMSTNYEINANIKVKGAEGREDAFVSSKIKELVDFLGFEGEDVELDLAITETAS